VDLYDWLLFLHVLSAFVLVASGVMYTTIAITTPAGDRAAPALQFSTLANRLGNAGGTGTLVFGVWLALHVDAYDLLDGWIVTALVLWVILAALDAVLGGGLRKFRGGESDERPAPALHAAYAVVLLALLAVMIFKPGA
jgi:uncharacterized membrane protein